MLLQGGPFNRSTNAISPSPFWSPVEFAQKFVQFVDKDTTIAMAKDDGAFIVSTLCERGAENEELKSTLKGWFDGEVRKELGADKDRRGRVLLLTQLERLSLDG